RMIVAAVEIDAGGAAGIYDADRASGRPAERHADLADAVQLAGIDDIHHLGGHGTLLQLIVHEQAVRDPDRGALDDALFAFDAIPGVLQLAGQAIVELLAGVTLQHRL